MTTATTALSGRAARSAGTPAPERAGAVSRDEREADVIVVGAGPAGSAAAYHLAVLGLDVLLLERSRLGRDKVCGDGLTPSAVRELVRMGVDTSSWQRNEGLRVVGGGHRLHFPWPEQPSFPSYGLARRRCDLDEDLARHAQRAGARLLTGVTVTAPVSSGGGQVTGVEARPSRSVAQPAIEGPTTFTAPLVIDAGGVSARVATAVGRTKDGGRPLGVAVRAYFRSPRAQDTWMESQLELWDGPPGSSSLLPGYGWIWSVGDGLVNVGLGSVASSASAAASRSIDYRAVFAAWMRNVPASWELTADNQVGRLASAALPMAFNRRPHYERGLMLLGDAGGMVSPFNGEGIAQALLSGRLAAEAAAQGAARSTTAGREQALAQYPRALAAEMGGYYTLGRVFVSLIEHPEVMRLCTRYGLPRKRLMRVVTKLLSDGWERRGGDGVDRLIQLLTRMVPSA
ncbi:geranylgeranyl reductase family protein [Actinomyces lilanjuaniae]|uniref:Geranylgeranyl reductase family protein n=1 Tax=Actinomyces lilanjuaniae TaxID=2321394 RepID=A0ABM6Z587_9ACTO|nr:geranylgeranyl reductase family protein [Actinomyces lilanjuaniae]AYD90303.1 geranylgeranyl reductase family protein [Actinomyces lilanjuaniae]